MMIKIQPTDTVANVSFPVHEMVQDLAKRCTSDKVRRDATIAAFNALSLEEQLELAPEDKREQILQLAQMITAGTFMTFGGSRTYERRCEISSGEYFEASHNVFFAGERGLYFAAHMQPAIRMRKVKNEGDGIDVVPVEPFSMALWPMIATEDGRYVSQRTFRAMMTNMKTPRLKEGDVCLMYGTNGEGSYNFKDPDANKYGYQSSWYTLNLNPVQERFERALKALGKTLKPA